jgi:membrane-anchored protein YejM (alkaline phosphatase superfamily)
LQRFFEKASRQPWFDNTVFVITADHPNQRYIPEYMTDLGCFTVPVLFYAPSMPEINGYNTETIAGQIDIMPTLLGMLGYERPYIAFGQDLLHTPVDVKFTVNYIEGIYQFLQGDLLLLFDGDKVKSVYRFKEDTGLQNDIKNELPETELTALTNRLKAIIQQYMERMNTNRLTVQQTDSTTK